ncbi:MAG: HlyD family type I secretion periplasmic adaptor subunit [Rhodospirillaceae bacterium]|nr:HlyD family type I secretion periplasmic adaptor subunit [Rhodospirillaceae bacterium]
MTAAPATVTAPSERVGKSAHLTFALCTAAVIAFGTWAAVSPLDIVSMATGEVIPSTQVKTVQHLEGGIIREISVREGESVAKGQTLVVLEPTASGADVGELSVRLKSLRIDEARIEGLIKGAARPEFPPDLVAAEKLLVSQASQQFKTQMARHKSELVRQREATFQRDQEIKEISTRIRNQRKSLKLVQEQAAISEDLLRDNLTNRFRHLDLLKELRQLEGGIEGDTSALSRARSALKEANAELLNIQSVFADENQKALNEVRLTLGELRERVKKFRDSLARTTVRSPVDGAIKTLHVVTVGGVIRPGDPIAELVPAGDKLIVEAKLPTSDIGYVAAGQLAVVKLASADAMRFGGLEGTVVSVSPDTLMTPDGMPYYKVRIVTDKGYFESGKQKYSLFPGMQMAVSIITGDRTVLEYILGPAWSSLADANRER